MSIFLPLIFDPIRNLEEKLTLYNSIGFILTEKCRFYFCDENEKENKYKDWQRNIRSWSCFNFKV